MKKAFYKYQGTGNDFIIFDDRENNFHLDSDKIEKLCDRRFGVGADGVILLRSIENYDFEMVYFNADGNLSSMCGNGGRCISALAKSLGIVKEEVNFLAIDGAHIAKFTGSNPDMVKLKMKDVDLIEKVKDGWLLNTGSPHLVSLEKDINLIDVREMGSKIRYSKDFISEGVNVNFLETNKSGISVRTYERGVEDETLSCGTGVTASALVAIANNLIEGNDLKVDVSTPGGALTVYAIKTQNGFSDIWLEGPAVLVFEGEIEI